MQLDQWLREQGPGAKANLSRRSGIPFNTILYLSQGKHLPSAATALKIERATGGEVTIADLIGPQARARMMRVKRAQAHKPKRKAARKRARPKTRARAAA